MAVITTVVLTLTVSALTRKFVLGDPEGITTDAGTVTDELALERLTVALPVAGPLRLTVQDNVAGGVTLAGVQVKLESTGEPIWLMVTEPPLAVIASELPIPLDATTFIRKIGDEVSEVAGAI